MSNRELKIKLFKENNKCFYCFQPMVLTHIDKIPKGYTLPPNAATLEHRVSRLQIGRWVQKRRGEPRRRVLACHRCNQDRSVAETLAMSRAEVLERSKGYSLSPRGNPKIVKPLRTKTDVKKQLGLD